MEPIDRIGMIARWQPVHLGHVPVLRGLCQVAAQALIGVGSANKYNLRNPFTTAETLDMLRLVLADDDNYTLHPIDDLDDGPRWRAMIVERFGPLDVFVTANPYVADLLKDDYAIIHPVKLVADEDKIPIDGTLVRKTMARGEDWQALVPEAVSTYLIDNGLDERFRREFGLQTLALDSIIEE